MKEYVNSFSSLIKPYSPDWITIRKPLTGDNYFPLDLEYSEIKVVPVLSRTDNVLIVRVPKDKVSLFDLSYGDRIFKE